MAPLNAKNFIWVFFISMLFNAGCASTLNPGYWEFVPVTTTPPGAKLVIFGAVYTSPATVWVPRGQGDYKLTIEKEGYKPGYVFLRQSLDASFFYNVPIVGHIIDLQTRAAYDLEPEVVDFTLVPEEQRISKEN